MPKKWSWCETMDVNCKENGAEAVVRRMRLFVTTMDIRRDGYMTAAGDTPLVHKMIGEHCKTAETHKKDQTRFARDDLRKVVHSLNMMVDLGIHRDVVVQHVRMDETLALVHGCVALSERLANGHVLAIQGWVVDRKKWMVDNNVTRGWVADHK